jgi:hypothetical protein
MAGVVNATQCSNWCMPSGLEPAVVDNQVLDELAERRNGSMAGIASAILIRQYSASFRESWRLLRYASNGRQ